MCILREVGWRVGSFIFRRVDLISSFGGWEFSRDMYRFIYLESLFWLFGAIGR